MANEPENNISAVRKMHNNNVVEEGKPIRGYRQRMFSEWRDRGMFESTEQRICDQARSIRKSGRFSELELEVIRRKDENESQVVVDMMDDVRVEQRTNGEIQDVRGRQENIRIDVEEVDDEDEGDVEIS